MCKGIGLVVHNQKLCVFRRAKKILKSKKKYIYYVGSILEKFTDLLFCHFGLEVGLSIQVLRFYVTKTLRLACPE